MPIIIAIVFVAISYFCFTTFKIDKGLFLESYICNENKRVFVVEQILLHTFGLPIVIIWYFWIGVLCILLAIKDAFDGE